MFGNLVGGLAFTGLTLYATHVRTAPQRDVALVKSCIRLTGRDQKGPVSPTGALPVSNTRKMRDMSRELTISIGQCSEQGRKGNQDFHGALIPEQPLLDAKGIAVALADGISTISAGRIAAEAAVKSFLSDYYCTPDSWSVKTSAQRVVTAINSWLHAQTRRTAYGYDRDRGFVCTFSALVVRSATAHVFHVGDSRIYRLSEGRFEQLTEDHRVILSPYESYLGRALGVNPHVEIDYSALPIEPRDLFVLATDGVHDFVEPVAMLDAVEMHAGNLDAAAKSIVAQALQRGSPDNLTIQILRIDAVPNADMQDACWTGLPPALLPDRGVILDGFRVLRELHASHRSHVYLGETMEGTLVALKVPSIEMRGDASYLKRLMMEEWVARRVRSPHLVTAVAPPARRSALYVALDYVEGQSLSQWMIDNPKPDLETVRGLVDQIARGLRALHRMEMLHQDLRPENVIIDKTETVRIVDLGSVWIAGMADGAEKTILGTLQYAAPEYFIGDGGSPCSDLFSLGVIAYQMLTGRLPYGTDAAKVRTRAEQLGLVYRSALQHDRAMPAWIDQTLRRAVHPDPTKRYQELSEFTFDMRHPNPSYLTAKNRPLLEVNPLLIWQVTCAVLAIALLVVLAIATRH